MNKFVINTPNLERKTYAKRTFNILNPLKKILKSHKKHLKKTNHVSDVVRVRHVHPRPAVEAGRARAGGLFHVQSVAVVPGNAVQTERAAARLQRRVVSTCGEI